MRIPNKLFSYEQSILSEIPIVLDILTSVSDKHMRLVDLYAVASKSLQRPQELIEILDVLYFLNRIDITEVAGEKEIVYVA